MKDYNIFDPLSQLDKVTNKSESEAFILIVQ